MEGVDGGAKHIGKKNPVLGLADREVIKEMGWSAENKQFWEYRYIPIEAWCSH